MSDTEISSTQSLPIDYVDIQRARERLTDESVVKSTPIEQSTSLGQMLNAEIHLKMEHLQWTGSFKTRGAYNKIKQSTANGTNSFVAASAGNHAQGVALAATKCDAEAEIFMPTDAPQTKWMQRVAMERV